MTPEEIIKTFQQCCSLTQTANICHCDIKTVRKVCENAGIDTFFDRKARHAIAVSAIDKKSGTEIVFNSQHEAAKWLYDLSIACSIKSALTRIMDVVQHKHGRKSAYGYIWKAADSEEIE